MNKEFEKWFDEVEWPKIKKKGVGQVYDVCQDTWEACKKQILDILEKNKHTMCSHGYDAGMEYVEWEDIKKVIKDL